MNDIPVWLKEYASLLGFDAERFMDILKAAAEKFDAPTEVVDTVSTWLSENVTGQATPDRLIAFVAFAYAELKSGKPGFNNDAGGIA